MNVPCFYCGQEFDPTTGWHRITGWERKAIGGSRRGGSDVVLRRPYGDQFACHPCVDALKHGRSTSQETML